MANRIFFTVGFIIFIPLFLISQSRSDWIANYRITASLDTEKKTLTAEEKLTWRNSTNDTIHELQFHLYFNAFKNNRTTFMRESGGEHRGEWIDKKGWGWISITSMKTDNGTELKDKFEFISPDDNNRDDQTVLRIPLPSPILPHLSISLTIVFKEKFPSIFARAGYEGDFFMAGQWFPKIGVYESIGMRGAKKSGWNCHQYHLNSEFYSDFGTYNVSLTLPESFVVGATGVFQSERNNSNGTKTVVYHADDVHDFAWTASPHFVDVTAQWRHVKIRAMMQPQHLAQSDRYISSLIAALDFFDRHAGPYPYTTLTIVDPAYGALGAAGMEYPTLITAGTFWGLGEWIRLSEIVTVHEFGHQYWYGMVANNEFEEAWLDEGINQYFETRVMDAAYGADRSMIDLGFFHAGDGEFTRTGYTAMRNPRFASTAAYSWLLPAGAYGVLTYNKPAVFLTTLEKMIGTPAMDSVMRTFFLRWKFKHPSTRDFIDVCNEVIPRLHGKKFQENLEWYFESVLFGTQVCDYEVTSITSIALSPFNGIEGNDTTMCAIKAKRDSVQIYETTIRVSRLGDMVLPVTVRIGFENGTTIDEQWCGCQGTQTFRFMKSVKAVWATIDPDETLALDINIINNSRSIEPPSLPYWKMFVSFLFWLQNIFQAAAAFG